MEVSPNQVFSKPFVTSFFKIQSVVFHLMIVEREVLVSAILKKGFDRQCLRQGCFIL